MTELLLGCAAVVVSFAISFGVSAYMRRGGDLIDEAAHIETIAPHDRQPLPHGRAAIPDATGANAVAADEI